MKRPTPPDGNHQTKFAERSLHNGVPSIGRGYIIIILFRIIAAASVFALTPPLPGAATVTPVVLVSAGPLAANVSTVIGVRIVGAYNPTGTVMLKEGATTLGSATMFSAGFLDIPVLFPAGGTHTLVAFYSGDANYLPAQSSPTNFQVVATTVVLSPTGPEGLVFGIHASVSGAGPCAGTVALSEGSKVFSTAVLQANAGSVDFSTTSSSQIPEVTHILTATFSNTGSFCGPGVSAPLTVYSGWPSSSTQVVSVSPNPSLFG
ncbi:MAG: Flagellar hook-length control protein FliK, partial [Bryobacterales bacterium]|nr:Flagellar hook-length control protein FliK [Bryobacterales bacterium]